MVQYSDMSGLFLGGVLGFPAGHGSVSHGQCVYLCYFSSCFNPLSFYWCTQQCQLSFCTHFTYRGTWNSWGCRDKFWLFLFILWTFSPVLTRVCHLTPLVASHFEAGSSRDLTSFKKSEVSSPIEPVGGITCTHTQCWSREEGLCRYVDNAKEANLLKCK